jgi:hypothetical protein
MRYQVIVSGKNLLLTQHQLEILMTAVQDAEQIGELPVGTGKGSQGYQKSYIPSIEVKQPHDWLTVTIVADDFVDASKLTMKLVKEEHNF